MKNDQPSVPQSVSKRLAIWFDAVLVGGVMYWSVVRFIDNWVAQVAAALPLTILICTSMWLVSGSLEKRPNREEGRKTLGLTILSHTIAVGLAFVLTKIFP